MKHHVSFVVVRIDAGLRMLCASLWQGGRATAKKMSRACLGFKGVLHVASPRIERMAGASSRETTGGDGKVWKGLQVVCEQRHKGTEAGDARADASNGGAQR